MQKIRSIDYLKAALDGGYAAESVSKVLNILNRIEQKQKSAPHVFITDSAVDLGAAAKLNAYLQDREFFRGIPVIMDKLDGASLNRLLTLPY